MTDIIYASKENDVMRFSYEFDGRIALECIGSYVPAKILKDYLDYFHQAGQKLKVRQMAQYIVRSNLCVTMDSDEFRGKLQCLWILWWISKERRAYNKEMRGFRS